MHYQVKQTLLISNNRPINYIQKTLSTVIIESKCRLTYVGVSKESVFTSTGGGFAFNKRIKKIIQHKRK